MRVFIEKTFLTTAFTTLFTLLALPDQAMAQEGGVEKAGGEADAGVETGGDDAGDGDASVGDEVFDEEALAAGQEAAPGEGDGDGEDGAEKTEEARRIPRLEEAFLHRPLTSAEPGKPVGVAGKLKPRTVLDRARLAYRKAGDEEWIEAKFKRSRQGEDVAEIGEEAVESPGVEYHVFLVPEAKGGAPTYLFASEEKPYRIPVHGYSKRSRYESRLAEWDGRLSRIEANYGYTHYGENLEVPEDSEDGEAERTDRGNYYHQVSIAYTYRFLTYLYALRVEVAGLAHDFANFKPFTAEKDEDIGPGMYYISPSAEFEFFKYFGASVLFRLGISEEEFEGGAGMSLRVGRINSTRLDAGFEGMSHAGWRLFLRFEWDTIPHVPMAFNLERTQWYASESYAPKEWASRLFYEIRGKLPAGVDLYAHGGFATRDYAVSAGFVVGGGLSVDF
jgi:hypothetical protein